MNLVPIGRFGALMQTMGRAGLAPAGAPLIVYHEVIDEHTDGDVEICVPNARALDGDGDVYSRELECGPMATTTLRGPCDEIGSAYHTVMGGISERGHEIVRPPREIYLNDPQTVPPEELLTRVAFPIAAAS